MEINYRKSDSHLVEVYFHRFILIVRVVVLAITVIFELAVAIDMEFMRMWVQVAMWASSLLWISLAITAWLGRPKHEWPLWFPLLTTALAVASVVVIYIPIFTTLTLWVNAVVWVLFLVGTVWIFPYAWKECWILQGDLEKSEVER